jgi:hypothetical protein
VDRPLEEACGVSFFADLSPPEAREEMSAFARNELTAPVGVTDRAFDRDRASASVTSPAELGSAYRSSKAGGI